MSGDPTEEPLAPGVPPGPGQPEGGSAWRTLVRAGSFAFASNIGVLVANTLTGIFTARLLGADGRGILAAVIVLPQVLALVFGLGCSRAVAFHRTRHPEDGGSLIATWLLILLGCFTVAYAVAFFLIPVMLAAQPDEAVTYARLYLLTVAGALLIELAQGTLLGQQRFARFNGLLLAQPVLLVLTYVVLWQVDAFRVTTVLVANAALGTAVALLTVGIAIRHDGLGRPSKQLARTTLAYGLKAHGTTLAALINVRLDLLIIPAFLAAASVGLYAVATNITTALGLLAGSLTVFVLPMAARLRERSRQIVVGTLWLTIAVATVGAVTLGVLAEVAIRVVYGGEFADAAVPLRILLTGTVPGIATGVLIGGLDAINRPLAGSFAIGCGALVTVVGLLLFLRDGGIEAAAAVSSAQAWVAFVLALLLYRRAAGLRWKQLVPRPGELRTLIARARSRGRTTAA